MNTFCWSRQLQSEKSRVDDSIPGIFFWLQAAVIGLAGKIPDVGRQTLIRLDVLELRNKEVAEWVY